MSSESAYQAIYRQVCLSRVQIELEAASYTPCPFVQSRVAAKTTRLHVLERLSASPHFQVLLNVLDNSLCSKEVVTDVALRMMYDPDGKEPFKDVASQRSLVWQILAIHPLLPPKHRKKITGYLDRKAGKKRCKICSWLTALKNFLLGDSS